MRSTGAQTRRRIRLLIWKEFLQLRRDPLLLRHLAAEGIVLDAVVSAERRAQLGEEALASIWVSAP